MEAYKLTLLILRVFQLIFAVVVLGVSVSLTNFFTSAFVRDVCDIAHDCHLGRWVPAVEYDTFVGVWGLLDALLGTVAAFVTAVPWIAMIVVDALAAIFYLAGGIVSPACGGLRLIVVN